MGLKGAVNGLVAKAATKVGISYLLAQVRTAAEGGYGPVWKARYDKASNVAPWTGLVLTAVTVGLVAAGLTEQAAWIGAGATVAVAAGIVNKAYLTEIPPALRDSRLYQTIVSWAPTTTAVLGVVWIGLEACTDPSCAKQRMTVLVVAAIAAKLGVVDAAWQAKRPPAPPRDGGPWR